MKKWLLLLILAFPLFATVNLKAPKSFYMGEPYMFTLEATGSNIEFPSINSVDGYEVKAISRSSGMNVINGRVSSQESRVYRLFPLKGFELPAFELIIDGKSFKTEALRVSLNSPSKTKNEHYDLSIKVDNTAPFVGEQIRLDVDFRYRSDLKVLDMSMMKPTFENFWVKPLGAKEPMKEGHFIVQTLSYLLTPQKEGELKIDPMRIDLSVVDNQSNSFSFFQRSAKSLRVFSNDLSIKAKALPQGVELIGDFDIKSSVDKRSINVGDAIAYKIEIVGEGNFEDIKEIKLNLPSTVTVYENESNVELAKNSESNAGVYTKSYSLLPTQSFTLPAIELTYYDKSLQKVVTKKSDAFEIEVKGAQKKQELLVASPDITTGTKEIVAIEKTSIFDRVLFFILGALSVVLTFGLYKYGINRTNNKTEDPLSKRIKQASSKTELLQIVLPLLKRDERFDLLIYEVEQSKRSLKEIQKDMIKRLKEIK